MMHSSFITLKFQKKIINELCSQKLVKEMFNEVLKQYIKTTYNAEERRVYMHWRIKIKFCYFFLVDSSQPHRSIIILATSVSPQTLSKVFMVSSFSRSKLFPFEGINKEVQKMCCFSKDILLNLFSKFLVSAFMLESS